MTEYTYGKAYIRRQFDGTGTRFRTDGTSIQMEVVFPLRAEDVDANDLIAVMKEKSDLLIEPRVNMVELVFDGTEPDERYLVISGWTETLNKSEKELAFTLTFH